MKHFYDSYVDSRNGTFIDYRTGENTYEEAFADGILYAAGWLGSGYTPQQIIYGQVPRMNFRAFVKGSAFKINIDGQELFSHWTFVSYEKNEETKGLHVIVRLHHELSQIDLAVHTLLDGTNCITRWLEITNLTDRRRAVAELGILAGGLQIVPHPDLQMEKGQNVYRVGYMQGANWGIEGGFAWHELTGDGYVISGRFARDRFRHPMFILENRVTGQNFICQIGYSGGWKVELDYNRDINCFSNGDGLLDICVKLDGYAPLATIGAHETLVTPQVHMGMVFGDADDAIFAMHEHTRKSVISHVAKWNAPLEVGLGPEMDMDIDGVMNSIDYSIKYGAEYFLLDCNWNISRDSTPFDWIPGTERYDMGVAGIRDYCHERGIKFGLWMEPERIFSASAPLMKKLPRATTNTYQTPIDGALPDAGCLAIDRDEVADYVFDMIDEVITKYDIDLFRLDHNAFTRGYKMQDGMMVYADFDYFKNLYSIFNRLREKHPNCVFENCASGGGRTDLGMMACMDHTWVTDWQRAPRSFLIKNGLTMCLPPEHVDCIIGAQDGHIHGSFPFQALQMLIGRPTLNASTVNGALENPNHEVLINRILDAYRDIVQPAQGNTRIYHHTMEFDVTEPQGTGIIERAETSGKFTILGVYNLANARVFDQTICLRGADVSKTYKVTFLTTGQTATVSGYSLAKEGVHIRLTGALTAETLLCVAE